mgnify:CR=1 FL=1
MNRIISVKEAGEWADKVWPECVKQAYAEQPAQQQEPVAWMCHPFGDEEVEYGPHHGRAASTRAANPFGFPFA